MMRNQLFKLTAGNVGKKSLRKYKLNGYYSL